MDAVLGDQYPTLSKAGETDVGAIFLVFVSFSFLNYVLFWRTCVCMSEEKYTNSNGWFLCRSGVK